MRKPYSVCNSLLINIMLSITAQMQFVNLAFYLIKYIHRTLFSNIPSMTRNHILSTSASRKLSRGLNVPLLINSNFQPARKGDEAPSEAVIT